MVKMSHASTLQLTIIFMSLCWSFPQAECMIGGNVIKPKEFKYLVHIQIEKNGNSCTGGILNKNTVLSAAHCLVEVIETNRKHVHFVTGRIRVIAGTNNLANKNNPGIERWAKKVLIHDNFKDMRDGSYEVDFGIIRLDRDLDMTDKRLDSLILPGFEERNKFIKGHDYLIGKKLKLAGFGIHREEGHPLGELRKADMIVYTENCVEKTSLRFETFCAKMVNHEHREQIGLCKGDVGAPLILNKRTVVGVLSYHNEECNENIEPSIFSGFTDYIHMLISEPRMLDVRSKKANASGYFERYNDECDFYRAPTWEEIEKDLELENDMENCRRYDED